MENREIRKKGNIGEMGIRGRIRDYWTTRLAVFTETCCQVNLTECITDGDNENLTRLLLGRVSNLLKIPIHP